MAPRAINLRVKRPILLNPSKGVLSEGGSRLLVEGGVADALRSAARLENQSLSEFLDCALRSYITVYGPSWTIEELGLVKLRGRPRTMPEKFTELQRDLVYAFELMCFFYTKACDVTNIKAAQSIYNKIKSYSEFVHSVESYISHSPNTLCTFSEMFLMERSEWSHRKSTILWTPAMVFQELKYFLPDLPDPNPSAPRSSLPKPEVLMIDDEVKVETTEDPNPQEYQSLASLVETHVEPSVSPEDSDPQTQGELPWCASS